MSLPVFPSFEARRKIQRPVLSDLALLLFFPLDAGMTVPLLLLRLKVLFLATSPQNWKPILFLPLRVRLIPNPSVSLPSNWRREKKLPLRLKASLLFK